MIKGEFILYGLENHKEVVDKVIKSLNIEQDDFGLRLILTEALVNAFNHGNKKDSEKPIKLRWLLEGCTLRIEVEDCGSGFEDLRVPGSIEDENLLQENGRGLYLISCFSDKVDFNGSTLVVEKHMHTLRNGFCDI